MVKPKLIFKGELQWVLFSTFSKFLPYLEVSAWIGLMNLWLCSMYFQVSTWTLISSLLTAQVHHQTPLFTYSYIASFTYYQRWLFTLFLPLILLVFITIIWGSITLVQTFTNFITPYDLKDYIHKDMTAKRYVLAFKQRLRKFYSYFQIFIFLRKSTIDF